jgi:hypothetical protein
LANLAKIGKLKAEPPTQAEFDGLLRSGRTRLKDAQNPANALESRFDLAYNAAHALSLAALRWKGYRSEDRYMVFQALPHTLEIESAKWKVLDLCHRRRNLSEYEGHLEVDEELVAGRIAVTLEVLRRVEALGRSATGPARGPGTT